MFGGFVIVGMVSTLCNLGSRYVFEAFSNYEIALAGANTVGVLSAYFLNRWFVFKPGDTSLPGELARFALINLAGILLSWLTSVILFRHAFPAISFAWHPDLVAHALGIAVPVIPNYWAHRQWTFAGR